ncbi:MAG: hypothetical protein ACTS2F_27670 [Thainema sp.]
MLPPTRKGSKHRTSAIAQPRGIGSNPVDCLAHLYRARRYLVIQMSNFFTFAFEFVSVSAFLFFATAFVIGFAARHIELQEVHAYQAPQPELTGQSTPFACPVEFEPIELDLADFGQQLAEAMANTDAALRECDVVLYENMSSAELRKHCTDAGIKWRNVHGKNKHMRKGEMVEALALA